MLCTIQLTLSDGSSVLVVTEGERLRMVRSRNGFIDPSESSAYYVLWESVAMNSNVRFEVYPIENGAVNFNRLPIRINSGRPAVEYFEMR